MKIPNNNKSKVSSIIKSFENYFSHVIDMTVEPNYKQKYDR